ncbi:hypothetical protein L1281_001774 [Neisseria sp. HSC-16F19]|nr:hypothetical protein [Neisseria sp. HSC-16F19]MCP2041180.1 hypothetical protein [Neisseria sp. HSC-16F19]
MSITLPPKFAALPQDEDTQIRSRQLVRIADSDVLHEVWYWDGVKGESLIFIAADLPDTDDDTLVQLAREAGFPVPESGFTLKHNDQGFIFLNFGFEAD